MQIEASLPQTKSDIPPPPQPNRLTPEEKKVLDSKFGAHMPFADPSKFALCNVRSRPIAEKDDTSVMDFIVFMYNHVLGQYEYDVEFNKWLMTPMKMMDDERMSPFVRIRILAERVASVDLNLALTILDMLNEIEFRQVILAMIKAYDKSAKFEEHPEVNVSSLLGDTQRGYVIETSLVFMETYTHAETLTGFPFVRENEYLWKNIEYLTKYPKADGIWVSGIDAVQLEIDFGNRALSIKSRFEAFKKLKQRSFDFEKVVALCKMIESANMFDLSDEIEWLYEVWWPQFAHDKSDEDILKNVDVYMQEDGAETFKLGEFMREIYIVVHVDSLYWISKDAFMRSVRDLRGKTDPRSNKMREYLTDYIAQAALGSKSALHSAYEMWMASFRPDEIRDFQEIVWKELGSKSKKYAAISSQITSWHTKKGEYLARTKMW